jgi:hypothetical protein
MGCLFVGDVMNIIPIPEKWPKPKFNFGDRVTVTHASNRFQVERGRNFYESQLEPGEEF